MTNNRDIRTIGSNLSLLRRRARATEEQTDISLGQLSELIAKKQEGTLDEAYRDFCLTAGFPTLRERAMFCRYMATDSRFAKRIAEYELFGEGEAAVAGTHGRVAYMRNVRADNAYAQFAKSRRGTKAYHVSSFAEGCEAVAGNIAEFCILPIENTADGKLYTFYSMLDRYGLKVCAAAHVADDDGIGRTVYALVGRKVDLGVARNVTRRFEFSVIHEQADTVCDITQAIRVLGGSLCAVGTQMLGYDDGRKKYYFASDFDSLSPVPLALFVSLEYPRYETVGLYTVK